MMIQTGEVKLSYLTTEGWTLHMGSGDRSFRYLVTFPIPFARRPILPIMVALKGIDVGHESNTRVDVFTDDEDPTEFTLVIHTWADTILYGVTVSWLAHVY